jgi:DNA-directed RNA polymerase specialized sigma24 family protein
VCLQVIRQGGREQAVDWEEDRSGSCSVWCDDPEQDGPEVSALRQEHLSLVRQVLADLPDRHRQLLELLVASPPVSYRDISVRLGMPIGSIGPTRARLLARLREALLSVGLEDPVLR